MEVQGYSQSVDRRVVNAMSVRPRRVDRRRYDPQAQPSTSFVDNTVNWPRRNFLCPEFGTKFQREVVGVP